MLGFRIEWLLGWRRRRAAVLNTVIPLILLGPIALSGAPPQHAAAVYVVFFAIFGTFGSAIPLVRDAENGILQRLVWAGAEPRELLLGRVLGTTALDLLQLAPVTALLLLRSDAPPPALLPVLAAALLSANALGVWVAVVGRSIAEAALAGSVIALFLVHIGGVFRTPAAGSWASRAEVFSPFHPLHELLLAGATGTQPAAGTAALLAGGLATAFALTGTVLFAGRAITKNLAVTQR